MTRRRSGRRRAEGGFRRVPFQVQETKRAADRKAIRAEALLKYARIQGGAPVMCTPPSDVVQARRSAGASPRKPKVIFKSLDDAREFAALIAGLEGEAQTAYLCEFSRNGHAHLTSGE